MLNPKRPIWNRLHPRMTQKGFKLKWRLFRNGNSAYFAALQQNLNTYSSNDSLVPKLTLTDNGTTPAGNEVLNLRVHQNNAKTDEMIKTDGSTTTDTTVSADLAIGGGLGRGIGPSGGSEDKRPIDHSNADSNSQGHWDASTNTYTSSNGYSY